MPLQRPGKLEKLQIAAFSDRDRTSRVGTFEAMFNPDSITLTHSIKYGDANCPGSGGAQADFVHGAQSLSPITLVLDGTGYADVGSAFSQGETVSAKVDRFLTLCCEVNPTSHEPNFLRLQWGQGVLQQYDCRVSSVDCKYSLFDRSGAPLRVELSVAFSEDTSNDKRAQQENRSSPDVSHVRSVRAGDTLSLMCQRIYGSAEHCLFVARANELDDFRRLLPGQLLVFPPLA